MLQQKFTPTFITTLLFMDVNGKADDDEDEDEEQTAEDDHQEEAGAGAEGGELHHAGREVHCHGCWGLEWMKRHWVAKLMIFMILALNIYHSPASDTKSRKKLSLKPRTMLMIFALNIYHSPPLENKSRGNLYYEPLTRVSQEWRRVSYIFSYS